MRGSHSMCGGHEGLLQLPVEGGGLQGRSEHRTEKEQAEGAKEAMCRPAP